ncbi:uncharacterized protein LOC117571590 [Drosophila albomicans]|uniref:Uncharacterized protein LOC117571590 n=1 Tax=Drosophila albomicans TaxID=7291 RepID=A0A6P8YWQ0_DROAB|nr:uncharacterized protein LOC117571590 [Drosophila albomicans]
MPSIKFQIPSNKTLGTICVYGAVVSISAVMYMRWRLEDRVRSAEYYKLALQTLRQHKGAVGLLGEPIKDKGFDISNVNNTVDGNKAQLEVTVRGPKDKGTIFFWATNNAEKGWLIDRLELETKQHPNKRFLLKKQQENGLIGSDQQHYLEQEKQFLEQQQRNSQDPQQESFAPRSHSQPQPLHKSDDPEPYIQTAEGGRMR